MWDECSLARQSVSVSVFIASLLTDLLFHYSAGIHSLVHPHGMNVESTWNQRRIPLEEFVSL